MKIQILSRRNAPVSIIGFLLLVITTLIGCGVFINRVIGFDPDILTLNDLHRMGVVQSRHSDIGIDDLSGLYKGLIGFVQKRGGGLTIQYWLFDSSSTAKKVAPKWTWLYAAPANFQPELNPEHVIGDATWRNIHENRTEWEDGPTDIYFVKHNVLVSVRTRGHSSHRLQDARDIARHIEAKIAAELEKK